MEFLSQKGVEFDERNINQEPKYIQELIQRGSRATPTTIIDDEVIIGFDRQRLIELLDL